MNKNKIFLFEIIAVVILAAIDFVTKQLAVKFLSNGSFDIIPGVFSFTLLEGGNSGAAFGMLQGGFWIFIVITIAVAALVIFMLRKLVYEKRYRFFHYALVLLLAGALGNFGDRVLTMIKYAHSYVIDFLYFELINFPIFNVADCYVTVAAGAMIFLGIFYYKDDDFDKMLGKVKDETKQ